MYFKIDIYIKLKYIAAGVLLFFLVVAVLIIYATRENQENAAEQIQKVSRDKLSSVVFIEKQK